MSDKLENAIGLLILITIISLITNLLFLAKILSSVEDSAIKPCSEKIKPTINRCYIEED